MSKIKFFCLGSLLFSVLFPVSVLAIAEMPEANLTQATTRQIQNQERIETKIQTQETQQQEKEAKLAEFCNRANTALTERSTKFSENQTLRMKFYSQIQSALQVMINNQLAAGLSTTELTSYQEQLRTKVTALTNAANIYQTALANAAALDCPTDRAGFVTALKQSNTAMRSFNTSRQDLHTFVRTKLYPMVNKMRLKALTPTIVSSPTPAI